MAKLLLLVCLFVLYSCNGSDCSNQTGGSSTSASCPSEPPEDPIPDTDPDAPVPEEALIFDAEFNLTNFEVADEEKLAKAIEIIKKVIATDEFKDKVLNFTYNGKKEFIDNRGYTNGQIYQILLRGKEKLKPEINHKMDLELELYYSNQNTVGYTMVNTMKIWMNTKYFDVYTPSQVAGNVFHEWTHKLGFDHATTYSVSRDYSVPYGLGYLIRQLGMQYE